MNKITVTTKTDEAGRVWLLLSDISAAQTEESTASEDVPSLKRVLEMTQNALNCGLIPESKLTASGAAIILGLDEKRKMNINNCASALRLLGYSSRRSAGGRQLFFYKQPPTHQTT